MASRFIASYEDFYIIRAAFKVLMKMNIRKFNFKNNHKLLVILLVGLLFSSLLLPTNVLSDLTFEEEFTVVSVEVTAASGTIDGNNSSQFSVTVEPAGVAVTSYQWIWSAPGNAGNNPQVNFATPNQQTTNVNNAHWFAFPDNRLTSVTGPDCEYTIDCNVTVGGVVCNDATPPTWRVYLPTPPAVTRWPKIAGMVTIGVRLIGGANQWYVTGIGTLTRTQPQVIPYIPNTSQFYNKIVTVHEGRHVTQLTTGVPGMTVHTLWDATGLYNTTISGMTSLISEADLRNQIQAVIDSQNDIDNTQADAEGQMAEYDAFKVSNAVAPDYLELDVPAP